MCGRLTVLCVCGVDKLFCNDNGLTHYIHSFRFDLNVEPMFAVMALYDAKEKKKISESFHLDCNTSDIQQKWKDSSEERSLASLARSAIFNITYPSNDVYLIIKVGNFIWHLIGPLSTDLTLSKHAKSKLGGDQNIYSLHSIYTSMLLGLTMSILALQLN